MYVDRYWSSLGTPFKMIIDAIRFAKYAQRVEMENKYAVCNPSDSQSSQRQSEDSNYIGIYAKKADFCRHNKYQSVKEFIMNQVETAWREGKYFIY